MRIRGTEIEHDITEEKAVQNTLVMTDFVKEKC
jgi:hypothetical protein